MPGALPFWAAAICDWTRALAASSSREVALEVLAALARAGQRRGLVGAHGGELVAAVDELPAHGRDLVAPRLDGGGDLGLALLELVEAVGGARRLGARGADAVDDARVLVRHALHELRAVEQVGEAVRVQHHRHDVGLVGLVELDQAAGERDARLGQPRLQPRQADALLAQLLLDARELRALGVEVGLDPDLLALQHGDVGLQRPDLAAVAVTVVESTRSRPFFCSIARRFWSIFEPSDAARERGEAPSESTGSDAHRTSGTIATAKRRPSRDKRMRRGTLGRLSRRSPAQGTRLWSMQGILQCAGISPEWATPSRSYALPTGLADGLALLALPGHQPGIRPDGTWIPRFPARCREFGSHSLHERSSRGRNRRPARRCGR